MIGWRREKQLLIGGRVVVTGAVETQSPLKVQELPHEVEVGRDVGLLPLDKVVGVVERKVELLHQVGHRYRDAATNTSQAVHQDPALFGTGFI